MKKTFFLDLDHNGVRLRYGTGTEFPVIGEVALDDPHFETRLEDLRSEAEALSDGPLETVLTIPQSEILFTSIEMTEDAGDDAARKTRIESELEGMTPYELGDLVYDWKKLSKSKIAVAAAARETLDQAEGFAVSHGFNPQGFTTEPKKGLFSERPDFGKTAHAISPPAETTPAAVAPVTRIADLFHGEDAEATMHDEDESTSPSILDISPEEEPVPAIDESRAQFTAPMPDRDEAKAGIEPVSDTNVAEAISPDAEPQRRVVEPAAHPVAEPEEAPLAFTSSRVGQTTSNADPSRFDDVASRIAVLPDGGAGPQRTSPKVHQPAGRPQSRPPGPKSAPVPSVRKVAPPAGASAASLAPESPSENRGGSGATETGRPKTEAEQMTVFGARKSQQRGGMSTLPVVIGLLIALAIAVGIWASFFMLTPTDEALLLPDERSASAGMTVPSPVDPPVATIESDIAAGPGDETAPGPDDPLRRPQGADEAGRYAAIGIDASAPVVPDVPLADRVEELRITALDADLRAQDRVARLAEIDDIDTPPNLATSEETSPENSGGEETDTRQDTAPAVPTIRPAAVPERPELDQPQSDEAEAIEPAAIPEPEARPRARPSDPASAELEAQDPLSGSVAVQSADAETPRPNARPPGETATEIAVTLVPQAAERPETMPRARPATQVAAVDPNRTDTARRDGSAAASAAAAALAGLVPSAASAAAPVARSVTPQNRPAAPERAAPVEVAQASAIARPSGPTSGSVASRATIASAMNLRQVNLMGVYGSESNRRALIRLPNGRFEKVQVGDRVDGGRVQAIGDNRLSYVKSGRQIVLEMPGG
ncbi:hypothetical protein [Palleronia sp. LCG004]|uniref:hypothetical protein n=1 Tax=Palleronia sp. LCG004 TaxID=3079304 RepID=UPI002941E8C3|nr:hypothetical protein [Palleronia sp. LCG004]WOI57282.1 hypothetical protein RVY76_05735 [Palleronia sp. LCG004]